MNLNFTKSLSSKEDLFKLYEELGWIEFLQISPEQLHTAIKQSFYSIFVYDENQLIATGRVVSDGVLNAYLCGVGVLSPYRNKGIGTSIMKKLKERCLEDNLHIQFFCEDHLIGYYEKLGFKRFASGMGL